MIVGLISDVLVSLFLFGCLIVVVRFVWLLSSCGCCVVVVLMDCYRGGVLLCCC